MKIRKFIMVELLGLGWGKDGHGDLQDYKTVVNSLAEFFRCYIEPGSVPLVDRNIVLSVNDRLDEYHTVFSDQRLVIHIQRFSGSSYDQEPVTLKP